MLARCDAGARRPPPLPPRRRPQVGPDRRSSSKWTRGACAWPRPWSEHCKCVQVASRLPRWRIVVLWLWRSAEFQLLLRRSMSPDTGDTDPAEIKPALSAPLIWNMHISGFRPCVSVWASRAGLHIVSPTRSARNRSDLPRVLLAGEARRRRRRPSGVARGSAATAVTKRGWRRPHASI